MFRCKLQFQHGSHQHYTQVSIIRYPEAVSRWEKNLYKINQCKRAEVTVLIAYWSLSDLNRSQTSSLCWSWLDGSERTGHFLQAIYYNGWYWLVNIYYMYYGHPFTGKCNTSTITIYVIGVSNAVCSCRCSFSFFTTLNSTN